ncbi:hypothetical protein [Microbulbifer halophilus]
MPAGVKLPARRVQPSKNFRCVVNMDDSLAGHSLKWTHTSVQVVERDIRH